MRRVILVGLSVMTTLVAVSTGCNRRVFVEVPPTCDASIISDAEIPAEKAADILIVVDNSGSMQEEQDRLALAFLNDVPGACPISSAELKDFARCDEVPAPAVCRFSNPSPELLKEPGPNGLAQCGFIQVLAAFENDFRIGVITTDVGICDNRLNLSQAGQCLNGFCAGTGAACGPGNLCEDWGYHPQRGCLQGPRGSVEKVISRQDLLDGDASVGTRFIDTLKNIKTFGTPIERGLDAAQLFLDPATDRHESCAEDLSSFIREDAKLVVIFLTDEEDCSRAADVTACTDPSCQCDSPDGCEIFFNCPPNTTCVPSRWEFANESCGEFQAHFSNNPADCYAKEANLTPVTQYVDALKASKIKADDVSVAVIAGGIPDGDGFIAAGCRFDEATGALQTQCTSTKGTSQSAECAASGDCCFADAGGRYYELADAMGGKGLKDTICVDNFGETMIKIAVFIADVDSLKLAEKPADLNLVVVEKARVGTDEFSTVERVEGTTCVADGWVLEGDGLTIRFCGTARPGPGERVRVSAKGEGADVAGGPDACEGRGTPR